MPALKPSPTQSLLNLQAQLRTRNFIPTVVATVIGYLFIGTHELENKQLVLTLAAFVLLCAFFTLQNDIVDYEGDRRGHRASPLVSKLLSQSFLQKISYTFGLSGLLLLVLTEDIVLFICGLIFILLCVAYNTRFVRNQRPVSSIAILALIMGALPLFAGLSIMNSNVTTSAIVIIAGYLCYRFSVSILKDYKDYVEDVASKKQTFLIKYGAKKTKTISIVMATLGYSLIITALYSARHKTDWLIVLLVVALFSLYQVVLRLSLGIKKSDYKDNTVVFGKLFNLSLYFDLGILVCLYIF